ncbi:MULTISPECIES: peptide chain release factor N(5)-glutamine methyltransferase [unclassified Spiroplasma]|uniref:peptide chain release factor N(5)-glutamine methyltransferase n=1 Tax=unclassified Spiroplasma TaxID=2637901 RepID=UPI0030CD88BF
MTYHQLLQKGEKLYVDYRSHHCKWLLAHLANYSLQELYANLDIESKVSEEDFYALININLQGKPLAYILGYQTFLGRDFIVNPNVFIPRTETQELVENLLYYVDDYFQDVKQIKVLDVATGSGAIAISLALEEAKVFVVASDISSEALKVAKANALNLNCQNIKFVNSNLLASFVNNDDKFDILVCNPPYIGIDEQIENMVKDYEPHLALFATDNGLFFYKLIFKQVKTIMNNKYLLAFEFGYSQKAALEVLVKEYFATSEYEFIKDISGRWRMLFIYNE